MARIRQHLLDADITRRNLEAVLGLKGRFPTLAFVSSSDDFPNAYDEQINQLKEKGPQTEQRKIQGDVYLWISEQDLKQYVTGDPGRAHFESIEKLQTELEKTGLSPVLAQNSPDGKTYILAYASRNRREVGLQRMLSQHTSRKERILQLAGLYDDFSAIGGELDDPETLKRLLRGQGVLEFRILPEGSPESDTRLADEIGRLNEKGPELQQRKAKAGAGEDYAWFEIYNPEIFRENVRGRNFVISECRQDGKTYVLAYLTPERAMVLERDSAGKRIWQLSRAWVGRGDLGGPSILFEFDPAGSRSFENLTRSHVGKPLGIFLDDKVYSAPNIQEAIRGSGRITGSFTLDEARQLANTLNAGSLMTKLQP